MNHPSFSSNVAIEVADDLRKYILEIYGDFLSPDGFVSVHKTRVYVHIKYISILIVGILSRSTTVLYNACLLCAYVCKLSYYYIELRVFQYIVILCFVGGG